jgi:ribose transport system substrate-binding protein
MLAVRLKFVLIALVAVTAAGCGGGDGGSDAVTTGTAGDASSSSLSIGLVPFSSADPTSNQAIVGVQDVAKEQGWTTSLIDAQGSPDKAVSAIQNLVQKKVDFIVTTVFPAEGLAGGLLEAKAAGIPVATLGGGTGNGVQANWGVGLEQGKTIAARLVEDLGGQGELLALGYSPGLPCREREQGLKAALEGTSIKLDRQEIPIPGQVEGGTKFTQAWLQSHPVKAGAKYAIWGCFDDPAIGALSALKQANRKDVLVYGVNGTPQALNAIRSGELKATVWINAYGAGTAMGKAIPDLIKAGVDGGPREESAPSVLVDKATLDDFLAEYPDAAKAQ